MKSNPQVSVAISLACYRQQKIRSDLSSTVSTKIAHDAEVPCQPVNWEKFVDLPEGESRFRWRMLLPLAKRILSPLNSPYIYDKYSASR